MKKVKGLRTLALSLVLCFAMSTTVFAGEAPLEGQVTGSAEKIVEVNDNENLTMIPAGEDAASYAATVQYDANRTITRSNSKSGVFYGNYTYSITNASVTKLCLDVYMPNQSGTDYLQGTITLIGSDGSSAAVNIANYSGDSWTLTFTGVRQNVDYYFYYELYSVGSSQVGYVLSAAYAQ